MSNRLLQVSPHPVLCLSPLLPVKQGSFKKPLLDSGEGTLPLKFPADHPGHPILGSASLKKTLTCWKLPAGGVTPPEPQLSAGSQAQHPLSFRSGSVTVVPAGASRQELTNWPPSTTFCREVSHPLACPHCHPTSCRTLPTPPLPSPKVSVCCQNTCSPIVLTLELLVTQG